MDDLTQRGIAAAKTGRKAEAYQLLTLAVKANPRDALAWLWLSTVVDTSTAKRICLENVLTIDPQNESVKNELVTLDLQREIELYYSAPKSASLKCNICGVLVRSDRLSKHLRKVHPGRVNPPTTSHRSITQRSRSKSQAQGCTQCRICKARIRSDNLRKHMLKVHPDLDKRFAAGQPYSGERPRFKRVKTAESTWRHYTQDGYPAEKCSECHRWVCVKPYHKGGYILHDIDQLGRATDPHCCDGPKAEYDAMEIAVPGGGFETNRRRH